MWEAIYILDGLLQNRSEIRPDTLHADTQGQSETVFGLAHLLAIQLMPRIRHWKNLTLYVPSERFAHEHISHIRALFDDPAERHLIKTHLPDMLRVVLSINQDKNSLVDHSAQTGGGRPQEPVVQGVSRPGPRGATALFAPLHAW